MTPTRKRQLAWIALALITVLLHLSGAVPGRIVERVYGHHVFPLFRTIFDNLSGKLPFPFAPVVFAFILGRSVFVVHRLRKAGGRTMLRNLLWSLVSGIGLIVFLFYLLWAWNYQRPSFTERLVLVDVSIDSNDLRQEMIAATSDLVRHFEAHANIIEEDYRNKNYQWDELIRRDMEALLSSYGYAATGRVQVRILKWQGFLLVWNTAGIYFPLSGEGHVDGGLLPVQWPAVVAHEMAHGYGVTDEGECNFISWLVCHNAADPHVRFSGLLNYWRYVASSYRRIDPEGYKEMYGNLPDFIPKILREISDNNDQYPEFLPRLRNLTYDSYLKMQGVREGLLSYSKVVALVHDYRASVLED